MRSTMLVELYSKQGQLAMPSSQPEFYVADMEDEPTIPQPLCLFEDLPQKTCALTSINNDEAYYRELSKALDAALNL
jgi:hypothetical protein